MNTSFWLLRHLRWAALFTGMLLPGMAYADSASVNIVNFSFQPSSVTINVGDTVTWTQKDTTQHTSTSDTSLWSSALLALNQTFSRTFDTPGDFPYHCSPHPFMMGSVTVQGAAANQPPTVSITSPSNGATLMDANVAIQAEASDPDGSVAKVEFFEGRTPLGTATNSPFQVTVTLGAGSHNLTAQATDNQGATASSGVVNITVTAPTNSPPTISIAGPSDGATFTAPASISIQAQANDSDGSISQVEFFAGGNSLGTVTSSPFTFGWTNVAAGDYALTAKATDNQGATTVSNPVNIKVANAVDTAPTLSGAIRTGDGKFQFTVSGTSGKTYIIQASGDLQAWETIQTVPATADVFTVTDTPPALAQRFYRVQLSP